jgi:hypothetical protein
MKLASKIAAVALFGVAGMGLTASNASAAVVCNAEGACWHVKEHYDYQPSFGVVVHPDDWRWGSTEHYTWREHEGRGYWHSGVWVGF